MAKVKIADFLERHNLSGAALSKQLGYTGAEAVNSRKRKGEDIPEHWLPRLRELGYDVDELGPLPETDDAEEVFRAQAPPQAPEGAPTLIPTAKLDYASLAGHIEGIYKIGAKVAIEPADPMLAYVVDQHAAQAGKAWARWIESEPKVAALVQRLMIGTPLGEVIGVHIGIFIAYFVARSSAQQLARQRAEADAAQRAAAGDTGTGAAEEAAPTVSPDGSAEDFLAAA